MEHQIETFLSVHRTDNTILTENAKAAIQFAARKHLGQTRSDGKPYISHPARVGQIIQQFKQSHNLDALISAAYLHDTIEDTNTTHDDLIKMFGGLIADMVKELTSDEEEIERVGKEQYLLTKMKNMSNWALVVKLADRLDNVSDIRTAKTLQWRIDYKKQTLNLLRRLEKERTYLSPTHRRLIEAIRIKLNEIQ